MQGLGLAVHLQDRGVYVTRRTTNGYRTYYSVRADGEEQALRTVAPTEDPTAKILWLWDDLNEHDPEKVTPAAVGVALRLLEDPAPGCRRPALPRPAARPHATTDPRA